RGKGRSVRHGRYPNFKKEEQEMDAWSGVHLLLFAFSANYFRALFLRRRQRSIVFLRSFVARGSRRLCESPLSLRCPGPVCAGTENVLSAREIDELRRTLIGKRTNKETRDHGCHFNWNRERANHDRKSRCHR